MLTCREIILDFLADYLEASLSPQAVTELEGHLEACAPCQAYLNTYRKTRELVSRTGQVPMPDEMKKILRRFLAEQLSRERP